jgi:hypothetical protein
VYQSDGQRCTTVWCVRCIAEAEQRSQPPDAALATAVPLHGGETSGHGPASDPFQHFLQEHLQLMDRALYDEEAMLIPVIHDFLERARLYQTHVENPEQGQRLAAHLQYWETFLKALNT